ncbi:hypothetical protein K8Z61_09540 [Nocardioides sp. TRM66260-LWL]|uniref:hypothetical protein n=1 Tax=Nocardioides sp. TRM66260-LWL TaxID=2874478 RepID=UPI001CC662DF|nr:hypothetical protein [Nocardioides sp. TRM66260-LWL]MBZ5734738.1 hypothetical protein [Nocardioides sp. TRM66260-LWL]
MRRGLPLLAALGTLLVLRDLVEQAPADTSRQAGVRYCDEHAASVPMCLRSWAGARRHHRRPFRDLRVTGTRRTPAGVLVTYRQAVAPFSSFVEVVAQDGQVRAVDPVLWVPRRFATATADRAVTSP